VETGRFERLVVLMSRMAAGDRAAVFTLYVEFGGHVAAFMRRALRRLGVDHVAADELDGLVLDACLALFDHAGAWDPGGGALPWNWAGRRLAAIAAGWVGQHADALDALDGHDVVVDEQLRAPGREPEGLEVLERLAPCHDGCELFREALERVSAPRDRRILLEMRLQADAGDPSPSVTVARALDMRPDAVRQVAKRTRDRLRALARREPRFAPLVDLPILG
jgi:hypothetical protein